MLPLVSIIIAVRNGERTIKKCLNSLLTVDCCLHREIIVVNDGSQDRTVDILNQYPGIEIIHTTGVGPSLARNAGVKMARGEFIAFTDGDCLVHRDWITELWNGFIDDKVAGVGGDQQSPPDETETGKLIQTFLKKVGFVADYVKKSGFEIKDTAHNPTCNVMYRRTVFDELHGFLPGLWPGEDVEFDYRLRQKGYRLKYNPRAIVYHYRPARIIQFLRMMMNYGRVQAVLVKKYGLFRFIHYEPIILVLGMVTECVLLIKNYIFALWLGLIFFILCGIYFYGGYKNFRTTLFYLRMFFLTLFAWNFGFIFGLVFSRVPPETVPDLTVAQQ